MSIQQHHALDHGIPENPIHGPPRGETHQRLHLNQQISWLGAKVYNDIAKLHLAGSSERRNCFITEQLGDIPQNTFNGVRIQISVTCMKLICCVQYRVTVDRVLDENKPFNEPSTIAEFSANVVK